MSSRLAALLPFFAQPSGPAPTIYSATRTLDRSFSGFPVWGGGNVNNNPAGNRRFDYEHGGQSFEVWQIIPFDGPAIGGTLGNAKIQLRNRDRNRGTNMLSEAPDSIRISGADWTGLPWTFTRTTNESQFTNVASGNSARKAVVYVADRASVGASPSAVGIAEGESFTIDLIYN